jgi:hypothetical protein
MVIAPIATIIVNGLNISARKEERNMKTIKAI